MKFAIYPTILASAMLCSFAKADSVYLGSGIKVGEVSHDSAIVWTRVTKAPEPVYPGNTFTLENRKDVNKFQKMSERDLGPEGAYGGQLQPGTSLEEAIGALPGASGEVRLTYYAKESALSAGSSSGWQPIDRNRDFTKRFDLSDLKPETEYTLLVDTRKDPSSPVSASVMGSFTTAAKPGSHQKVTFTVATCTLFTTRDSGKDGYRIFDSMRKIDPTFFVHAGDNVYYDLHQPFTTHIDLARYWWNREYGLSYTRTFLQNVPAYFLKDDHDSWDNDCWPTMPSRMGSFTYEHGLAVYDEQVPMSDKKHYRTFRWGKDLQIWLVEVRDHRSQNFLPDGPDKSLWGKEQVEWFKRTVQASDATFKFLISPTPLVGPDHLWKSEKNDNHVDSGWTYEGDHLRDFISKQKNLYVICGDRHWQYISRHTETGVIEYGCGAATDQHAILIDNPDRSMHQYYGGKKGGFLSVTIERIDGVPTATMRHHDVLGETLNEDKRFSNN